MKTHIFYNKNKLKKKKKTRRVNAINKIQNET